MSIKHLFLLVNRVHTILQVIWLVGLLVGGLRSTNSHRKVISLALLPQPSHTRLILFLSALIAENFSLLSSLRVTHKRLY